MSKRRTAGRESSLATASRLRRAKAATTTASAQTGTMIVTFLFALPNFSNVEQVIVFFALLSVLVVFHEFGHFVMAKRAGVTVTDFAIGFGPSLLALKRGDTTYRVNLLPLGGYCKMVGEDVADDGSADPGNFQHKSVPTRFGIIAAGPVFNLLLAAIVFAYVGAVLGIPTGITNVVSSIQPDSPAAAAGLAAGDRIVALDGMPVRSGSDMVDYIHAHGGKTIAVDVIHQGHERQLHIKARSVTTEGQKQGQFGFLPQQSFERKSVLEEVGITIAVQFVGLADAIRRHDSSGISGPVGIARAVITAEQYGVMQVLNLMAIISVVLGVFNLLPLPALDGGRLAFLFVELLRGRPVDPEKEGLVHLTGFALLMVVVLFVTYHDIVQWVNGRGGL